MDGNSVAVVLGAAVAGVVSLGTFAMTVINWYDQRHVKQQQIQLKEQQDVIQAQGDLRSQKIDQVKELVNGRLGELKIRIAKEAFEMGRSYQKEHPSDPSPDFPRTKADEYIAAAAGVNEDGQPIGAGVGSGPLTPGGGS